MFARRKVSSNRSPKEGKKRLGPRPAIQSPITSIPDILQRAVRNPQPADVLTLQRAIGNRATLRLLGRSSGLVVQRRLAVGPVNDVYEREASRVARQVVQAISSSDPQVAQRQADDDALQTTSITPLAQLQAAGSPAALLGGELGPELEGGIQTARGGGHPLAADVRAPMEQAFSVDFSGVRVHDDAQSESLNRSLHAQAFTTGQDIFFRQGAFNPRSAGGQELLAHELTHVVQQTGTQIQRRSNHSANAPLPVAVSAIPAIPLIQRAPPPGFEFMSATPTPAVVAGLSQNVATQTSAGAAAQQLYTNYWNYAANHWTYNASGQSSVPGILQGNVTQTYCGPLSDTLYIMALYVVDQLPNAMRAAFTRSQDHSLATKMILTNAGLNLIGQNPHNNIKTEINGSNSAITADNYTSNRFYFYRHWRIVMVGATYDPLFNQAADTVAEQDVDYKTVDTHGGYKSYLFNNDTRVIQDPATDGEPAPCFGIGHILLRQASQFDQKREDVKKLYRLLGAGWLKQAWKMKKWKPAQAITQKCVDLINNLGNFDNFKRVLQAESPNVVPMLDAIKNRADQAG